MRHNPQREHQPGRHVRVEPLAARRLPPRRRPSRDSRLVDPKRQITTPSQPGLIGWPVPDPIEGLWNAVATGCVVRERHRRSVARAGSRRPAKPQLPQPRCTDATYLCNTVARNRRVRFGIDIDEVAKPGAFATPETLRMDPAGPACADFGECQHPGSLHACISEDERS